MCGGAANRENCEGEFEDLLCEDCLNKVKQKLLGRNLTLFDFDPSEYGFCRCCWKKVQHQIKLNEQNY